MLFTILRVLDASIMQRDAVSGQLVRFITLANVRLANDG